MFKSSIDEDYYKQTLVKCGYNSNYIQYESKRDKILTVKEYLGLIEPYLLNMINDYKSKGEWKIQLTAEINFTSLKLDSDKTHIMHTKSDNTEFMIKMSLLKNSLNRFCRDIKKIYKKKYEVQSLNLMVFIYCIMILIKQV